MTWTPIKLRRRGEVAFIGEAEGAGGGSLPQQEIITGAKSAAPGGDVMPWGHDSGDALLDYTDPDQPTVVAAGLYAFSLLMSVDPDDGTAAAATLVLPAASLQNGAPLDGAVGITGVEVSGTVVLAAGDALGAEVIHNASTSRDVSFAGYVVLVTPTAP